MPLHRKTTPTSSFRTAIYAVIFRSKFDVTQTAVFRNTEDVTPLLC